MSEDDGEVIGICIRKYSNTTSRERSSTGLLVYGLFKFILHLFFRVVHVAATLQRWPLCNTSAGACSVILMVVVLVSIRVSNMRWLCTWAFFTTLPSKLFKLKERRP